MTTTSDPSAAHPRDDAGLARMTLVEHLTELRSRLMRSILAVTLASVAGFIVANRVLDFLVNPYCEAKNGDDCRLLAIDPLEGFATRIKIALFVGATLSAPVVLWQVWRFVTPGLHKNEKRYAIPFIAASMLLFVTGAVIAVLTFPKALDFLMSIGGPDLVSQFSPARYLSLYLKVVIAFGISFEFPVALVFLQLAKVLKPRQLSRWRRGMIVGIVIFAAVITPSQDPISLLALAIPMYILYEASILIGKLLRR